MEQQDLWNDRYRQKGSVWGAGPNQFVARHLSGLTPRRVLDLGAGQGRNAVWLAQQGHNVTAVDISDVAVAQAREIALAAGVEANFVAADVLRWDPDPEAFDLVLLSYLQAPEPQRKILHEKAARALAPGGRLFLIAHHLDNLERGVGGPQRPEFLFTESMVAADFPGLIIEENATVARHVETDEVAGDALDLLFIAVKPES